jgi:hypothetical protein
MLKQVRRWLPERAIVVVGDSRFSVLELLHCTSQLHQPVHLVSRLRLDAALYQPAPPRQAHQMGRPRLKGKRLPHLADVLTHAQTLWQSVVLPGLYGNTERQLGIGSGTAVGITQANPSFRFVETQRQWSDLAILRTTPARFGLFSFGNPD